MAIKMEERQKQMVQERKAKLQVEEDANFNRRRRKTQ